MISVLIIVNPNSRSGNEGIIDIWISFMKARGYTVEYIVSKSQAHTCELISQYQTKVTLVLLAGGDGTMSSAAAALKQTQLPFGIIPLGTANDLARSIGLFNTEDIESVCRAIEAKRFIPLDLGTVNGQYFFNVAHIGLAEKVSKALTSDLKKFWGVFSYLRAFFIALSKRRGFTVKIHVAGEKMAKLRSIQLAVGNGRYYGGGNLVDENSRLDDGLLRVYSIKPVSTLTLLGLAPYLRLGKHLEHDEVFCTHGQKVAIKTRKTMTVYADGEAIAETPAHFECHRQAVKILSLSPTP